MINDTVLRLNDDGSCEPVKLKGYPTIEGDSVTSTVDPVTGAVNYTIVDKTVVYTYNQSNPSPGVIELNIIGTEMPSGTEVSNQTITFGNPGNDALEIDTDTGVVTVTEINDVDDSTTVKTFDLESWLQNQILGTGGANVDWVNGQFVITTTDNASTLVDNGDGTYTWTPVAVDGNPTGTPVVITDTTDTTISSDGSLTVTKTINSDGSETNDLSITPPCVCSSTVVQSALLGTDYRMGEASGATWEKFIASVECEKGCSVSMNVIPTPSVNPFGVSAGYHSTMIKTANGVAVSGSSMAPDGQNQLVMTEVNQVNGYDYSGDILLFKAGGYSYSSILTTEGLYVWGRNVPWGQRQLPAGVSPSDVKEMHITESTFMTLTTKSGDVYATTDLALGIQADTWAKQPIADVRFALPIIESMLADIFNLKAVTMFAVTAAGDLYTWGIGPSANELLGDGQPASAVATPTLMVNPLPAGAGVKKLGGVQRSGRTGFLRDGLNYLVLGSDGKVYALGDGAFGANGNGSEDDTLVWITVQDEFDVLSNVADIQTSHHVHGSPSVMSISTSGIVKSWGGNVYSNIGVSGAFASVATVPLGIEGKTYAGAIGGHLSPVINAESAYYGNVGHNAEGGFGDGTLNDRASYEYRSLGANAPAIDIVRLSISCPAGLCAKSIEYINTLGEAEVISVVCCE